MFGKLWKFLGTHKIVTVIALVAVTGGGYWVYRGKTATTTETRYVLAAAAKDTIVTTVTGSGQVSAFNQLDLKAKASGTLLTYNAAVGQQVKAGQLIAQIDATDALKAVRDAQSSLDAAKLSLQKLQQPADTLTQLQAQDALTSAQEAKTNDQTALVKTYEDGFNSVANAYLDLPDIMSSLDDILYGSEMNHSQSNIDAYAGAAKLYDPRADGYRTDAADAYAKARASYDANFDAYKASSRTDSNAQVETLISQTYDTTRDISDALKAANNLIQFYVDQTTLHGATPVALAATQISDLNGDTSKVNGHLTDLLNSSKAIQDGKDGLVADDRTIAERQASLDKTLAGADPLDVQSSQISVQQRQNALYDAQQTLADYSLRAPFDGQIAAAPVKKGDSVSSGTTLVTLISPTSIAQLSLNEVDIAKVAVGQKADLTFDVLPDLSITGTVIEIDTLGTVSQGVVTYGVKIAFDTQDERIKPGMSVSASIITQAKTDALLVPSSAVKTSGGSSYVEEVEGATAADAANAAGITSAAPLKRVSVQAGLSNDTQTEIVSGLNEGDLVVARTVTATTTATPAQSRSILQAAGAGGGNAVFRGGGGGGFRAGGGG